MRKKYLAVFRIIILLKAQDMSWDTNGLPVRQGVHIEWQRTMCPAEPGSMIFVWSDTRYGSRNIFAQKVDSSGSLLWGTGGSDVTNLPGRQEDPVAITDGDGGATIRARGIHDIGYVYHAEFSRGYLFTATREGLQIFEIDE